MICTYETSDKDLSKSLPHALVCNNTGGCDYEIPTSGYWRSDLAIGNSRALRPYRGLQKSILGLKLCTCARYHNDPRLG